MTSRKAPVAALVCLFMLCILSMSWVQSPEAFGQQTKGLAQSGGKGVNFSTSFDQGDFVLAGSYSNGALDGSMLFSRLQQRPSNLTVIPQVFNSTLIVDLEVSHGQYSGSAVLLTPPGQPVSDVHIDIVGNLSSLYLNSTVFVNYGKYPIQDPIYGLENWTIDEHLMLWWENFYKKTFPGSATTRNSLLNKSYGMLSLDWGKLSRQSTSSGGKLVGERDVLQGQMEGDVLWLLFNPLSVFFGGRFPAPNNKTVWQYVALNATLRNVEDARLTMVYTPSDAQLNLTIDGNFHIDDIVEQLSQPIVLPGDWHLERLGIPQVIRPTDLPYEWNQVSALNVELGEALIPQIAFALASTAILTGYRRRH